MLVLFTYDKTESILQKYYFYFIYSSFRIEKFNKQLNVLTKRFANSIFQNSKSTYFQYFLPLCLFYHMKTIICKADINHEYPLLELYL